MNKLIFLITFLFTTLSFGNTLLPTSVSDLKKSSVRIYAEGFDRGGTGSIYQSVKNKYSRILTNKHVCRLIETGGYVNYNDVNYAITHYKKFKNHDLCLINIPVDLGINLKVSDTLAKPSELVRVSGHPNLLPHIASIGHLSDEVTIDLVVGIRECTEKEKKYDLLKCLWFGGMPVVQDFDSVVISNLIKPGSSGSAVFNLKGELVGVVYAGNSRGFSYGYIVPHIYLLYFTQNEKRFPWKKVGEEDNNPKLLERIFNYEKCRDAFIKDSKKFKYIKDFCKQIEDNMLWSK